MIAAAHVSEGWYLGFAAILFSIGAVGLLVRRNVLVMFMCVELMLNAVNVTFVAFSRALDDISGQAIVFFVLVVAHQHHAQRARQRERREDPEQHDLRHYFTSRTTSGWSAPS